MWCASCALKIHKHWTNFRLMRDDDDDDEEEEDDNSNNVILVINHLNAKIIL